MLLSMFPAYAREGKPEPKPVQAVNSKIVIDDNASGGYEGDYVVIYNPSTSSSSSYSTGTLTGLIDTTINANIQNSASINDESDLPLYKIDVDSYLNELAKENEVTGSRIMGGGFGGCTINLVRNDLYKKFIENAKQKFASGQSLL